MKSTRCSSLSEKTDRGLGDSQQLPEIFTLFGNLLEVSCQLYYSNLMILTLVGVISITVEAPYVCIERCNGGTLSVVLRWYVV